jgi:hypothetical protein
MRAQKNPVWEVARWLARLWSIGPVVFLMGEFFYPQVDTSVPVPWMDWLLVALLAISALALILAWWRERLGAWLSLGSLAAFLLGYWAVHSEFFPWQGLAWLGVIVAPALVFLLYSYRSD